MTTPQHCPGFEQFKHLASFICKCTACGAEQEVFSDEFKQKRSCKKCHREIDFNQCEFYAGTEGKSAS